MHTGQVLSTWDGEHGTYRMLTPGPDGRVTLTFPALIQGHRLWVPWLCVKLVPKYGGGWEG